MILPEFLTANDDGEIRLTGHRIGLYHVVARYNEGESAEMLACRYTTLPLALVHRVIAFYLENLTEVDTYIAGCTTELDRQQELSQSIDPSALRRRLATQGTKPKATESQVP